MVSQWFIRKTCSIVCYSQAIQGDQRRHRPAQYLFYVFSNHNILHRSQLVQAWKQSPKELTAGKDIEGQWQLLNVWIKKSAHYWEKMQLRTPCRKFVATPLPIIPGLDDTNATIIGLQNLAGIWVLESLAMTKSPDPLSQPYHPCS